MSKFIVRFEPGITETSREKPIIMVNTETCKSFRMSDKEAWFLMKQLQRAIEKYEDKIRLAKYGGRAK